MGMGRTTRKNLVVNRNGQFYGYVSDDSIRSWKRNVVFRDGAWWRVDNEGGNVINPTFGNYKPCICGVCGSYQNLTWHHILPKCYRMSNKISGSFKRKMVMMCQSHHEEYEILATRLKIYLIELSELRYTEHQLKYSLGVICRDMVRDASIAEFFLLQDFWEEHFINNMRPRFYETI